MYKLVKNPKTETVNVVNKQNGNILLSVPFDSTNTDYQNFKKEVLAGAELQDADGNVMTQEQISKFIENLP